MEPSRTDQSTYQPTHGRGRPVSPRLHFTKMHGLGNDFMVVDLVTQRAQLTPELIRRWADRRTGIGFDSLLTLEPPHDPDTDFRYRFFNADGSEAEQCGNGARCIGRFVSDQRLSPKGRLVLDTNGGRIAVALAEDDTVEVDMGVPQLQPERIPFDTRYARHLDGVRYALQSSQGEVIVVPVSLGNPHAVIFVDDVQRAPVATLGAELERHPAFPARVNVGFCEVVDGGFARLRVFERGIGETRACGSGACAAVVAGQLIGRLAGHIDGHVDCHVGGQLNEGRATTGTGTPSAGLSMSQQNCSVKVSLPGGKLRITWPGPGTNITMTGPACSVFEGQLEL